MAVTGSPTPHSEAADGAVSVCGREHRMSRWMPLLGAAGGLLGLCFEACPVHKGVQAAPTASDLQEAMGAARGPFTAAAV